MKSKRSGMFRAVLRCVCAVVILALAVAISYWRTSQQDALLRQSDVQKVEATCTSNGYTLLTNRETGETTMIQIVPAKGHSFGQWETRNENATVGCTPRVRSCLICGWEENGADYEDLGIARLSLYGSLEGIGKMESVDLTAEFEDQEQGISFQSYATLKHQGHSSLGYSKKNFTLKFFEDENCTVKNKLTFSHWNKEHKYILKANYIDPSQSRNLVCADIWAEICASRSSMPDEMRGLSNYGAVDGFPIAVYLNDQFLGLYTMNLHKDDDLFGMEDGERQAIMICNVPGTQEAEFRGEAEFSDDSSWEVEFCGTEDDGWAKQKLNELIRFVMTSDDDLFRAELGNYLDVDGAIDYLLTTYALGLTRHGSKDLVLVNYGSIWIPSHYDMEDAFGLLADGSGAYDAEEFLPFRTDEGWTSATENLLWDRLLNCFEDEIAQRYAVLRETILTTDGLCGRVSQFTDMIPEDLYAADAACYPPPAQFDAEEQMIQYIQGRLAALDEIFLAKE